MNTLIDLQGQIERITYTNPENGYTIARVKVYGQPELVTVVGSLLSPTPGEILKMKGEWSNHPRYGEQFKIVTYDTVVPATVYGIQRYLGSGLIRGIGKEIAKRIVNQFGEKTLEIIESQSQDLIKVEGIGEKRLAMIKKAWDEQKEIREVMVFLQSHGVSSGYATKIFRQYGQSAISIVKENPYRLAMEISGIGFITADHIAEKLGFAKDSPMRAEAGIIYVLHELSDEGNTYYPYEPLITRGQEILGVEREVITSALERLAVDKKIIMEDMGKPAEIFNENNKAVYLEKFHFCETRIAHRLKVLLNVPKSVRLVDEDKAVKWVQGQLAISLADKQIEAIRCAIKSKVMVITGGPGTGKTTIIHAILKIFSTLNAKILLSAPTGRAAKRMTETTGHPAKTIHRMLEYSMATSGFLKNDKSPLHCDILIVDEASMIDTILMYHLLKALPNGATLILVGDVNQLPSVGAGNVLNDIIASKSLPVAELNEIFRQARESRIIVNAHKINKGIIPFFESDVPGNDFYFIQKEAPEAVLNIIIELVKERIHKRFGFDPINEIQVLTPMNRGIVGAGNLNLELQKALNPEEETANRGIKNLRVKDKVMQIKNNYNKEVFNGDIGRITYISLEDQEVAVNFEGREVIYDFSDLDEIVLAYAVSVHKSQGSEYPAVVIPIVTQHYMLLQRNLIYTAVTRGRKLVVMVGTMKALAIGVKNDKTQQRHTGLRERLMPNFI